MINNYVPKESVYYYTKKQPFEENAKLPLAMAQPLHELVMTVSKFYVSHTMNSGSVMAKAKHTSEQERSEYVLRHKFFYKTHFKI